MERERPVCSSAHCGSNPVDFAHSTACCSVWGPARCVWGERRGGGRESREGREARERGREGLRGREGDIRRVILLRIFEARLSLVAGLEIGV